MSTVILAHGADFIDFIPVLFILGAAWVIMAVLNEGKQRTSSLPTLPRTPIERQMRAALRPERRTPATSRPAGSGRAPGARPPARPPHRSARATRMGH